MGRVWIRVASIHLLLLALPAAADWPVGGKGVALNGYAVYGYRFARFYDLPSGDLGLLTIGVNGNQYGVNAQRISATGDLRRGWTTDGVGLATSAVPYDALQYGAALDDSACIWIGGPMYMADFSSKTGVSLVRPDAVRLPGAYAWPTTSPASDPGTARVAPAPGGAYVAFLAFVPRIQRMSRSGSVAPGWPANGVPLGLTSTSSGFGELAVVADGAGGAIAFTADIGPFVQRVDGNAVRHAGWPAAG